MSAPATIRVVRLTRDDVALARATFAMMATVFEEDASGASSDDYLGRLLAREDFIALSAVAGDMPVGGITAHVLPMTRAESFELFIYDLAVRADHQRRGIGRRLVIAAREAAAGRGIDVAFVPADNEDDHAIEFYRALGGDPAPVTIFSFGKLE